MPRTRRQRSRRKDDAQVAAAAAAAAPVTEKRRSKPGLTQNENPSPEIPMDMPALGTDGVPLCRFFVMQRGACRYGAKCVYSHAVDERLTWEEAMKLIQCPYFASGNCRYGSSCNFRHGPNDSKQESDLSVTQSNDSSEDTEAHKSKEIVTCGICLEDIRQGKLGLMSNCNHVFCFKCLMAWRKQGSQEAADRRSCPTCREHSDYVIPSNILPSSEGEKQRIIRQYKKRLSKVHCHRFDQNKTLGSCPFGSDCLYAHIDANGRNVKANDKTQAQLAEERKLRRSRRLNQGLLSEDNELDMELEDMINFIRIIDLFSNSGMSLDEWTEAMGDFDLNQEI